MPSKPEHALVTALLDLLDRQSNEPSTSCRTRPKLSKRILAANLPAAHHAELWRLQEMFGRRAGSAAGNTA